MKRYLEINLQQRYPAVIVKLAGEIGPLSHVDLLEAARSVAASGLPVVILDFQEVEYMNSAGISGLIQFLARLGSRGQAVYACGLSSHDRLVLTIMRLTDYFILVEDPQAAINDYTKNPAVLAPQVVPLKEVGHERPQV